MRTALRYRRSLAGPSTALLCAIGTGLPLVRDLLVRFEPAHRQALAMETYTLMVGAAAVGILWLGLSRAEIGLTQPIPRSLLLGSAAALALLAPPILMNGHFRTASVGVSTWIVLAVLAEELYFRGLVFAALHRVSGLPLAVLGSSVLFALAHAAAYPGRPLVAIAIASLFLGVLRALSNSLLAPATTHLLLDLASAGT